MGFTESRGSPTPTPPEVGWKLSKGACGVLIASGGALISISIIGVVTPGPISGDLWCRIMGAGFVLIGVGSLLCSEVRLKVGNVAGSPSGGGSPLTKPGKGVSENDDT